MRRYQNIGPGRNGTVAPAKIKRRRNSATFFLFWGIHDNANPVGGMYAAYQIKNARRGKLLNVRLARLDTHTANLNGQRVLIANNQSILGADFELHRSRQNIHRLARAQLRRRPFRDHIHQLTRRLTRGAPSLLPSRQVHDADADNENHAQRDESPPNPVPHRLAFPAAHVPPSAAACAAS